MPHRTVQDVMTPDVVTVGRTTPFKEIAELLAVNDISSVPVTDESGRVLGLVSEADLLREAAARPDPARHGAQQDPLAAGRTRDRAESADGLMTTPVFTARPEWSLVEAARAMEHRKVKQLPVTVGSDRLVGIVSRGDLLRVFLRRDSDIREEIEDAILRRTLQITTKMVHVSVVDAVVSISGQVQRRSLLPVIERLCAATDGVVSVHSQLTYGFDDTGPAAPTARA